MQKLIVLSGSCGSGKSTLANTLRNENTVVVSTDDKHYKNGVYVFQPHKLAEFHKETQREALWYLERGASVVVDNTNIYNYEAKPYVKMAVDLGIPVEFIRCTGEFPNVHGVPDDIVARMRNNIEELSVEKALASKAPWEK